MERPKATITRSDLSATILFKIVDSYLSGDNKEKLSSNIGSEYASDFCHDRKSASWH